MSAWSCNLIHNFVRNLSLNQNKQEFAAILNNIIISIYLYYVRTWNWSAVGWKMHFLMMYSVSKVVMYLTDSCSQHSHSSAYNQIVNTTLSQNMNYNMECVGAAVADEKLTAVYWIHLITVQHCHLKHVTGETCKTYCFIL